MPSLPESPQWRHEAQRLEEYGLVGQGTAIPRAERIEFQPAAEYSPPRGVKQAATPDEYEELCRCLEKLRTLNNEFLGERTSEVEIHLATSGEHADVSEALRQWCSRYFGRRMKKHNPKDRDDLGKKWERLTGELENLLEPLRQRPNSINYLVATESLFYIRWLLGHYVLETLKSRQGANAKAQHEVWFQFLNGHRFVVEYLLVFLDRVLATGDTRLTECLNKPPLVLAGQLESLADDINEMRPFLVRGFDPAKTAIELGDAFCIGWDWATRYRGVGQVITASSERSLVEHYTKTQSVSLDIKMRRDGVLVDGVKPWLSMDHVPQKGGVNPLAVNLFIVQLIYEKLFSFYGRIDFARLRRRAKESSEENLTEDGEVFAESVRRLAETDLEPEPSTSADGDLFVRPRAIRPLRMRRLLRLLEVTFGCEVGHGKGSEITVYRYGHKKYVLNGHKRDQSVSSMAVKRLLSRLGIGISDWLSSVDRVS